MPLDSKLLRTIYAVAREFGVSNEELHEAIQAGFQKQSLKKLTKREACHLIDGLKGKPASRLDAGRREAMASHGRKDHRRQAGETEYLVNAAELNLLQRAAALRNWPEATLAAFVERQLGRQTIRTMAEFNKVFWALKAMNRRDGLAEAEC